MLLIDTFTSHPTLAIRRRNEVELNVETMIFSAGHDKRRLQAVIDCGVPSIKWDVFSVQLINDHEQDDLEAPTSLWGAPRKRRDPGCLPSPRRYDDQSVFLAKRYWSGSSGVIRE